MHHKIKFDSIPWQTISTGAKQKQFIADGKSMRLLSLNDHFVEINWCTKGHIGYILDGKITLDFNRNKVNFKIGDAFIIKEGESNKHKAIVEKGHSVELLLIEEID